MTDALAAIGRLVQRESGIDVERAGVRSLQAAIAKVAPGTAPDELLGALSDRRAGASLRALLIEALVVHETFFFRQRRDLDAIDWQALQARARAGGSDKVRVWVAACATGEEAYTIGILASEAFRTRTPPVSILATDISAAVLLSAEHARYRARAVHAVTDDLVARYFERDGEALAVGGSLRALVRFRRHNLVQDPAPGRFELILCRNALIYFDPATVERVLALLEDTLAEDGELILSAADRLCSPAEARPPAPRPRVERRPARNDWRTIAGREAARPEPPQPATVDRALAAADAGRLADAVAETTAILAADPLDVAAYFVRGIAELGLGDAAAAADSLRRALYVEPGFGLAAFKLGSAYDALGDDAAARRAYAQALRTLRPDDAHHARLAADVDAADVAEACRARLAAAPERLRRRPAYPARRTGR